MGKPWVVNRESKRRLGDRRVSPEARRRMLMAAIATWVILVVGGFIIGFVLRGRSPGVITGGLGAAAGAVIAWVVAFGLVIFVGVKRDREK